ncbi:MAG: hypothetical protein IT366_11675 [Candidatus Hydrogenedentes bacterium]|nr:hypothetical protein [Candidatus Hydrogenedentota bacterium]
MEDAHFAVEGAGTTVVHPVGLIMLLLCGGLFILLPRRQAIWPFILLLCVISPRQAVAIGGFNLYFARFVVLLLGPLRGLLRGELNGSRWNRLDLLVVLFGLWSFFAGALNFDFSAAVMKQRSGYFSEMLGTYFLCRMLLRDIDDVKSAVSALSLISLPILMFFLVEYSTGRNMFSAFGGVPEITTTREGRMRCQGAFGHPIMAGVFWATMLPLILAGVVGRWRGHYWYIIGSVAGIGAILLTASSTPLLGIAVFIVAWCLFPVRRYAKYWFMALGLLILLLHLIMKSPVWSLIQRIDVTPGNSAYHRYIIVDAFMTHAHEWWLMGSRVGTEHWGHFTFDTANQFVSTGVSSGILGLCLLFMIISVAMRASGRMQIECPELGWGTGVSIFVLSVCFFGISIWAQMHFAWAFPIAIAGSLGFKSVEPVDDEEQIVGTVGVNVPWRQKIGQLNRSPGQKRNLVPNDSQEYN